MHRRSTLLPLVLFLAAGIGVLGADILLAAGLVGCTPASVPQTACQVIKVANAACLLVETKSGEQVQLDPEDLEHAAMRAKLRRTAASPSSSHP